MRTLLLSSGKLSLGRRDKRSNDTIEKTIAQGGIRLPNSGKKGKRGYAFHHSLEGGSMVGWRTLWKFCVVVRRQEKERRPISERKGEKEILS